MVEADVRALAHAGEDALGDVLSVFAEYIAPIVGLIFGWVLGGMVGGVAAVGQFTYNLLQPIAKSGDPTRVCDAVGGLVMGGVFAIFGGMFWGASSKFGKGKWGPLVAKGLLRFVAGIGFGMAASDVISGLTGSVSTGWIDQLALEGPAAVTSGVNA